MPENAVHVSIQRLWAYAKEQDPASLPDAERDHLRTCAHCTEILWLCNTLPTLEDVQLRLKSRNRTRPT